jgi:hypothetical protein
MGNFELWVTGHLHSHQTNRAVCTWFVLIKPAANFFGHFHYFRRLTQTHARSTAVFVDEFDASSFQGTPGRQVARSLTAVMDVSLSAKTTETRTNNFGFVSRNQNYPR